MWFIYIQLQNNFMLLYIHMDPITILGNLFKRKDIFGLNIVMVLMPFTITIIHALFQSISVISMSHRRKVHRVLSSTVIILKSSGIIVSVKPNFYFFCSDVTD